MCIKSTVLSSFYSCAYYETRERTRALIAFERFMARLDGHWVLKGGSFLQLRTEKARKTQNIGLLLKTSS
jgi:hypothetical protein